MINIANWLIAYFINSVWQIPVLVICTAGLVKATARGGTDLHYRLWVGCLLLCVALPGLPIAETNQILHWHYANNLVIRTNEISLVARASEHQAVYTAHFAGLIRKKRISELILLLYALSLLAGVIKLLRRLAVTRYTVRNASPLTLPQSLSTSLHRLTEVLEIAAVDIYGGEAVQCPSTVMWPRPMLLLPAHFISVPEEDAVAAIAHELAHARQRDFETNLCIEIIALPVFYNPAIQWIKDHIADAREVLCDEVAANATRGRTAYAKSLLRLAENLVPQSPTADLSLGILEGNSLEKRIMKLIDLRSPVSRRYRAVAAVECCAVLFALSVGLLMFSFRNLRPLQTATGDFMASPGMRRAGNVRSAPVLIYSVEPEFTVRARKAKASGEVLVNLWVDEKGNPRRVRTLRGLGFGLDAEAIAAVQQYRFRPAMENGQPVPSQLNVVVNFEIF